MLKIKNGFVSLMQYIFVSFNDWPGHFEQGSSESDGWMALDLTVFNIISRERENGDED